MRIKHYKISDTIFNIPDVQIKNIINVFEIGHSTPSAGYCSNPLTANTYVIHYVVQGKGLCAGQPVSGPCIFVRFPRSNNVYSVDSSHDSPHWEQYWIKFSGEPSDELIKTLGVTPESPVTNCNYINQAIEIFTTLQNSFSYKHKNDQLFMLSNLFLLLSLHNSSSTQKVDSYSPYTRTVCNYIHENYAHITNETELANIVHISVNHLGRVFKTDTGMTPLQYLTSHRISRAMTLLQTTNQPISTIARSVGFSNSNYFCNVFKKHCKGLSPKAYREKFLHIAQSDVENVATD